MKKTYPAILHPEEEGYWVEFPDLPGCLTEGKDIDEAVSMASEALGAYLAARVGEKLPIADPSDIRTLKAENDDVLTLVSASPKALYASHAVKKTLSIPEWMNREAEARHINFSKVLQDALVQLFD